LACAIFSSGLQLPLSRPDGWRRKEREAKLFSNILKIIYFYITYISKLTFEPQIQMASSHSTEVLYLAAWQAHHLKTHSPVEAWSATGCEASVPHA